MGRLPHPEWLGLGQRSSHDAFRLRLRFDRRLAGGCWMGAMVADERPAEIRIEEIHNRGGILQAVPFLKIGLQFGPDTAFHQVISCAVSGFEVKGAQNSLAVGHRCHGFSLSCFKQWHYKRYPGDIQGMSLLWYIMSWLLAYDKKVNAKPIRNKPRKTRNPRTKTINRRPRWK